MLIKTLAPLCVVMACASGCKPAPTTSVATDIPVCEVNTFDRAAVAAKCRPGDKVAFLPSNWGNDQLPLVFAAINCDLEKSVVYNNGGVVCIYRPSKIEASADKAGEKPGTESNK